MKRKRLAIAAMAVLVFLAGMLMPAGCGAGSIAISGDKADRDAGDVYGSDGSGSEGQQAEGFAFDASRALEHIERLSAVIGPRPAGSEGESEAAAYITAAFEG